eukprot:9074088-Ditylum_brightwellii.AAC.1
MATTFPVGVTNSGSDHSNAFLSQHKGCKQSGLNLLVCNDCITLGVDVSGRGNTKQRCIGNCSWVDQ